MAHDPREKLLQVHSLRLGASSLQGQPHSLSLQRQQMVHLQGASGSGKTSLLRALVGFHPFLSGEVRLGGQSWSELGLPTYRRRVSLVAQAQPRLPGTVQQLFDRLRQLPGPGPGQTTILLAKLGLDSEHYEANCSQLSQGQWQRVLLAVALSQPREVLLLDEPFAALDEASRELVIDCVCQVVAQNHTALLWTGHQAVAELTNETWQIDQGCVRVDKS